MGGSRRQRAAAAVAAFSRRSRCSSLRASARCTAFCAAWVCGAPPRTARSPITAPGAHHARGRPGTTWRRLVCASTARSRAKKPVERRDRRGPAVSRKALLQLNDAISETVSQLIACAGVRKSLAAFHMQGFALCVFADLQGAAAALDQQFPAALQGACVAARQGGAELKQREAAPAAPGPPGSRLSPSHCDQPPSGP